MLLAVVQVTLARMDMLLAFYGLKIPQSQVATILESMVESLARDPSARLLKHVVRCYLRLTDNPRAREALARQYLPNHLKDSTFMDMLQDDTSTKRWLMQLLRNISECTPHGPQQVTYMNQ